MKKKILVITMTIIGYTSSIFASDAEVFYITEKATPASDTPEYEVVTAADPQNSINGTIEGAPLIQLPSGFLNRLQRAPLKHLSNLFNRGYQYELNQEILNDKRKFYEYMHKKMPTLTQQESDEGLFPIATTTLKSAEKSRSMRLDNGEEIFDYSTCNSFSSRIAFTILTIIRMMEHNVQPSDHFIITSIGSGDLFDTYLLLASLKQLGFNNVFVNIIDPIYPVAHKKGAKATKPYTKKSLKKLADLFPERVSAWKYTEQFITDTGGKTDLILLIDPYGPLKGLLESQVRDLLQLPNNENAIALEASCGQGSRNENFYEYTNQEYKKIIRMMHNDHF